MVLKSDGWRRAIERCRLRRSSLWHRLAELLTIIRCFPGHAREQVPVIQDIEQLGDRVSVEPDRQELIGGETSRLKLSAVFRILDAEAYAHTLTIER
jgi:hypothetical protein